MGNIEKVQRIKSEKLSSEYYFQSLLDEASKLGLITNNQIEIIQLDFVSLLAKHTESYTNGDSSSISVDLAQSLMDSIMFTIGVCLKTYPDCDEAALALQKEGINVLYINGLKIINKLLKATKKTHTAITDNLMRTKNEFYHSTIVDGIEEFFEEYYPEFEAQEIYITADYPVHHQMEPLLGIEFINKYIECIYFENLFCTNFSTEDIHNLLCGYDKNYEQLLFNIYEPVLLSTIGSVLTDSDVYKLDLTPSSIKIINDLFVEKTNNEIEEILTKTIDKLSTLMKLPKTLKKYLYTSIPALASKIQTAVKLETMDQVFIVPKYAENHAKLFFSFGDKMDNEKYSKVLEEIIECRYISDKKALINAEINSLADLDDILLDAELSEEEILSIISDLNPAEIAGLIKKHSFPTSFDLSELRESEILLMDTLQKFLHSLPKQQQEKINQAISILDIIE